MSICTRCVQLEAQVERLTSRVDGEEYVRRKAEARALAAERARDEALSELKKATEFAVDCERAYRLAEAAAKASK